jgi:hypothetical protein
LDFTFLVIHDLLLVMDFLDLLNACPGPFKLAVVARAIKFGKILRFVRTSKTISVILSTYRIIGT